MAFCNSKEEFSALLCDIPFQWRDAIIKALECVLSVSRNEEETCDGIKECETLTYFEPIQQVGETITLSYKDEKGVVYTRSVSLTTIVNNILDDVDSNCLMPQEEWDEMTFAERMAAIYAKACCVYTSCCGCEECEECEQTCVCTSYLVTGTAPYTVTYKDCDTKLPTEVEVTEAADFAFCALKGTVVITGNATYQDLGECGAEETTSTTTTTSTSTTTTSSSTTTTTTIEETTTTTTTTTSTTTTSTSTTTTTTAAPTTTTTTSSTTTTTTAIPLFYYIADEYDCPCALSQAGVLVTLPQSHTVQVGKFYIPSVDTDKVYTVVNPTPQTPNVAIALTTSNFTTCGGACLST